MKIIILIFLLFTTWSASSIRIYQVSSKNLADLVIYITSNRNEANLIIYKTQDQFSNCNHLWYFTLIPSDAQLTIFITSNKAEAQKIVFFTDIVSDVQCY